LQDLISLAFKLKINKFICKDSKKGVFPFLEPGNWPKLSDYVPAFCKRKYEKHKLSIKNSKVKKKKIFYARKKHLEKIHHLQNVYVGVRFFSFVKCY
jgi:hypothetical protein